ncbi:hypothetical protein [Mycobacteroides abscessus]|uniref:hypothetical protein n=1 Tax=Mycobacteroides abscessus TaxID=36809 RepID=UPI0009A6FE70|nr:hypothetical protein [Mycobacteroides abscessus]SKU64093.1 putative helicase [Mycobacteroides abscessus subsp. massiliense]
MPNHYAHNISEASATVRRRPGSASGLREAIRGGLLSDYQILAVLVSDRDIQDATGVWPAGPAARSRAVWPTHQSAVHVALAAAHTSYRLRRIVVIHNSVPLSRRFTTTFPDIFSPGERRTLTIHHLDEKTSATRRAEILAALAEPASGSTMVLSTTRGPLRALSLPAIDAIVPAAPLLESRELGHFFNLALRVEEGRGQPVAIVLPAFLADDTIELKIQIKGTWFDHVRTALRVLARQDPELADEILELGRGEHARAGRIRILDGHGANLDRRLRAEIMSALYTSIRRSITAQTPSAPTANAALVRLDYPRQGDAS